MNVCQAADNIRIDVQYVCVSSTVAAADILGLHVFACSWGQFKEHIHIHTYKNTYISAYMKENMAVHVCEK